MQLPIFKSSAPEVVEKAHYLCVILSEGAVQACLLAVTPYAAAATVTSPIFAVSDSADLIIKADQALQELGPESEAVQDTIFCCSSSWVDENGVLPAKQAEFDKLCKELSLRPLGYIVLSDVVSEHVVSLDPFVTGLYFIASAQTLQVILIVGGKILTNQQVGVSGHIVNDCKEAFGRLVTAVPSQTQLPTTWQLVSHVLPETVLSEYQQEILEYDWSKEPLFATMPVVEYWSSPALTGAIASAAGKVLARQISGAKPVANQTPDPTPPPASVPTPIMSPVLPTPAISTPVVPAPVTPEPTLVGSHDNLAVVPAVVSAQFSDQDEMLIAGQAELTTAPPPPTPFVAKPRFNWQRLRFWHKKSGLSHKRSAIPAVAAGLALGLLVTLLVISQLASRFVRLTVLVTPKQTSIQSEFKVTLDSTLQTADLTKLLLPGKTETVSITVSGKTQATGKKEVGDKASGQVKILNKTTSEKTFNKGTALKSDGLVFELYDNVTVPAATVSAAAGGSGELKSYGQAEASISAKEIGTKYNLKADSTLTLADLSTSNYSATVTKGLTGGTSEEVVVITAKDRERLSAELQSEALKDAIKQFEQKNSSQRQFVPPSKVAVTSTKFNQSEGDQKDVLELTLVASASALSYSNTDVASIAREVLKSKLDLGEELSDSDIQLQTKLDDTSIKSSKPVVTVSATADRWPKLDRASLIAGLAGRSPADGRHFLSSRDELADFQLVLTPRLVGWLSRRLPVAEKIQIQSQSTTK